jgi:hypothetical protein
MRHKQLLELLETHTFTTVDELLKEFITIFPKNILFKDIPQKVTAEGKAAIKKNTTSTFDYYFELLRIYYVNYKKAKRQFTKNNFALKKDCLKFIRDNNIKVTMPEKGEMGGAAGSTEKKEDNTSEPTFEEAQQQQQEKKQTSSESQENTTENTTESKYIVSNLYPNFWKELLQKIKEYLENQTQIKKDKNKEGKEEDKQATNYKSMLIKDIPVTTIQEFFKEAFQSKSTRRYEYYKNFFKRLVKKIAVYTHPDKTSHIVLQYFFLKSRKKYEKKQMYYLVFLIKLLEIKLPAKYTRLHSINKEFLESFITEFLKKRNYFVQCPVFNYHKMNPINQKRLVKYCLTNNKLEFNLC